MRATFLRALLQQVGAQVAAAYEPRPGFVMHMVNSLAAGGTERQSAVTAVAQKQAGAPFDDVVVVRTDPAGHALDAAALEKAVGEALAAAGCEADSAERFVPRALGIPVAASWTADAMRRARGSVPNFSRAARRSASFAPIIGKYSGSATNCATSSRISDRSDSSSLKSI